MSITELEQRCNTLRNDLKAWEKQFAAQHNGKKAGREDIKADAVICTHATYEIMVAVMLTMYSAEVQGIQQATNTAACHSCPSDTLETNNGPQADRQCRANTESTTESPSPYTVEAQEGRRTGSRESRSCI